MKNVIQNGECRTNTGFRQIAFQLWDSGGIEINPVAYKIFSGYTPNRSTYQIVYGRPNEYIIRQEWNSKTTRTIISQSDKEVSEELLYIGVIAFEAQYPELYGWLTANSGGRETSYLPIEGETLAAKSKRRLFEKWQSLGLTLDWDEFMRSPKEGLKMDLKPFSEALNLKAGEDTHSGSMVGISRDYKLYWSDGKKLELIPLISEINSRSNYAHEDSFFAEGETLGEYLSHSGIPEWATQIIYVVSGAYTRDHWGLYSYGYTVTQFNLK